jgi:5-methylthioadenosine/S-adenosylhomocysteine deaminase
MLYEHVAPMNEFAKRNIPMALATDCAPSNDGADLWSELKLCGLIAKHLGCTPEQYTPEALFKMVSTNPARVLGIDQLCGTIAASKAADLVFIERDLLTDPHEHPLAALIYAAGARNVTHVMVNGSWVLWQRQSTNISQYDMYEQYTKARSTIWKRAGL